MNIIQLIKNRFSKKKCLEVGDIVGLYDIVGDRFYGELVKADNQRRQYLVKLHTVPDDYVSFCYDDWQAGDLINASWWCEPFATMHFVDEAPISTKDNPPPYEI